MRQKGKCQNGCFKKTKHAKFSEKRTFLTPWYAHVGRFRTHNSAGMSSLNLTPKFFWTYNHFPTILRLFDVLPSFPFHHKWNDARLLLITMVYTSCLGKCLNFIEWEPSAQSPCASPRYPFTNCRPRMAMNPGSACPSRTATTQNANACSPWTPS